MTFSKHLDPSVWAREPGAKPYLDIRAVDGDVSWRLAGLRGVVHDPHVELEVLVQAAHVPELAVQLRQVAPRLGCGRHRGTGRRPLRVLVLVQVDIQGVADLCVTAVQGREENAASGERGKGGARRLVMRT
jgi:hypothetical protein